MQVVKSCSIFSVFLSLRKHIPVKTNTHRKYYTTAISVEALHKYKNKLIILGVQNLEKQSKIRTILYAPNIIYTGNANIQTTQEKLAYAYQNLINLMLNKKVTKTKKKSSKKNVSINSFYVENNEIYGIQTTYNNEVKSFVTNVYKYSTESDSWELYSELKHEADSEDMEGVGLIVHTKDLIGPYILRAEVIIPKNVIQSLLSTLKIKSSKEIENEDYELHIDARVIVIDISTLNYVSIFIHTEPIKEKLKWLSEIVNSYGADKEDTYIKIIKETKKINLDKIFNLYVKSLKIKYSYVSGEYNTMHNSFSNLTIEPVLTVESEIGTIGNIVIKKALDLGHHEIENIVQIGNVLATNLVMAVENENKKIKSYFRNPRLKGFSNDSRIFCYHATLEKDINGKKDKIVVTVIHAWDDKSGFFYQYIYDKDAVRSVIAYIEDKYTKKSVGVIFSTYKEGFIVIALLDTKNNVTIIQEFKKIDQTIVYANLNNMVRIFCGKRYTVNKPSIGEFDYYTEEGNVITAFKIKRFYDNVETNYWNDPCKRYIVISDYPKQQCTIYTSNLRGIIKEDTFMFLHDAIQAPILGTRRSIIRSNNTCVFFELRNTVLITRGFDLSNV